MTVAMVLTSQSELGETGKPTGVWLEELAVPYYEFRAAGFDVILASPEGRSAPLDPLSQDDPWLSDAGRRFLSDPGAMAGVARPAAIGHVQAANLQAVFFVGGMGTVWDFPNQPQIASLIESLDRRGAAVAGICHGVVAFLGARRADGAALLEGRKVTAFSLQEDRLLQLENVLPVLPETALRAAGAVYSSAAEPLAEHVVEDGNLLTGQNPASAAALARAVVRYLKGRQA